MPAEGTPPLGLVALARPGLAPCRRLHLLGQLLRAAGRDQRPLAADRDPHAFQRIKHDAPPGEPGPEPAHVVSRIGVVAWHGIPLTAERDRKSTRLNSSHMSISYAVFCLKKK